MFDAIHPTMLALPTSTTGWSPKWKTTGNALVNQQRNIFIVSDTKIGNNHISTMILLVDREDE